MRTNVSKAYRVFVANPLSCWVYWWPDLYRMGSVNY
jgi:hypothetical protein